MNPKVMRWSVIISVVAAIVVQSMIKSGRPRVKSAPKDDYEEFLGI